MKNISYFVTLILVLFSSEGFAGWERGDRAYVCIKVPAAQCLLQWGFGCGWESCRVRILEPGTSTIRVEFEESCGMGTDREDRRWFDQDQIFSGSNCNDYLN